MAEKKVVQKTSGQSKTARASMRAGEGNKRIAVAWVFKRKVGVMQTKPFATYYDVDLAKADFAEVDPAEFMLVAWADLRKTK